MRVAPEIVLSNADQRILTQLAQSDHTPARIAQRARIVLLAARGLQNKDIAAELQVGRVQVARWRERYRQSGLAGIEADAQFVSEAAQPGPQGIALAVSSVSTTPFRSSAGRATTPPARQPLPASRHGVGTVAPAGQDSSRRDVMRGFEFARNAKLVQGLEDVVGLYAAHPTRALVLSCDASAAPAPSTAFTATLWSDEQLRQGAEAMFDALARLDADGVTVPIAVERNGLLDFLRQIERETPGDKTLHVIADSDSADMTPALSQWLASQSRLQLHVAPAAVPWLSSVEWFFSHFDDMLLRQSPFASLPILIAAIDDHVAMAKAGIEQPFHWTRHSARLRAPGLPHGLVVPAPGRGAPIPETAAGAAKTAGAGGADALRDYVTTLKRERILQEAAALFFEYGYLQTTVDAIAERLGATKPFVYYHFNSKVDILVEICERSNRDALAAAVDAMTARGSPRVRFEQFLREFTDVVLRQHQMVAIYFREQISLPQDAADRINKMRKEIDMRLTALLREGIESGDFQIEDPRIGALVIAGMSSYAFAWYREDGRLDQQEVTDRIVRMALKLISSHPYYPAPTRAPSQQPVK